MIGVTAYELPTRHADQLQTWLREEDLAVESLVVEGIVLQVVLAKLAVLIANSLKEFQFINSQIQVWKKKGIKMGQVCDETPPGFQGLEDF